MPAAHCPPLLAAAALALGASAQSVRPTLEATPVAQLRVIYLECARQSEVERLPIEVLAYCSEAADVLREREFGGSLDAQVAWWRSEKARHQPTPAALPRRPSEILRR
ncbi:hypothetical protein [Ramlibacter rhizophilus]|uniref:DUF1311 domain-containing protein n=1 Tax=Ramlibacter rhizophilus TaxID=1781167 RepID=A0A4Z0BPB4_9BURK|nr:hypothetical protein [Ramlibacter rhizophilus]TFY99894.1 hypothetical protein EZ242_12225 [Ramlibacter rhizophilus]